MAPLTASLAPALGRLAVPPGGSPWEPIRLQLLDDLVAAHESDRLDGAGWLMAWVAAVTALRDQVISDATVSLRHAALHSRLPETALARLLPAPDAADRLLQRMLAEGIALEALEDGDDGSDLRRRRGAALEEGWLAAAQLATIEAGRYRAAAERVKAWRRPWRSLIVVGSAATIILLVVAAMLAGLIVAPGWFRPVVDWFWGLPWP